MTFRLPTARLLKDWIRSPFARGLMFYLVLPNLAFFLLGREFFIDRAHVNCDYLFLWIGSCYLSRRTTIVLYTLLVCLDLVLSTESIYHFSTVETIVMVGEFFKFYPVASYLTAGGLLALVIAAFATRRKQTVVRPLLSRSGQILVGTFALALSAATVVHSSDPFNEYLETFGSTEFAGSGIIETGLASYKVARATDQNQNVLPAPGAATSDVERDLFARGHPAAAYDIVLILVESQGLFKNSRDMQRLLAPLTDAAIRERYTVHTGAVRFFGATMFGELRTLCRIYVPQASPQNLPRLDGCLPNVLGRLGYETVSYHGFNKWFYERYLWYPPAGFQRSYFAEELTQLAPPMCGPATYGVCDLWIADQIEHELAMSRKKKFIYWLTLNSHFPVDFALAKESSFDCAGTETLREEDGPCALARIHYQLYTRIAGMALNSQLPPTRYILVGDHMPPFVTLSERALYDEERVPFVELMPREPIKAAAQR